MRNSFVSPMLFAVASVLLGLLSGCGGGGGGATLSAPSPLTCAAIGQLAVASAPVQPLQITLAKFVAAGTLSSGTTPMPDHCEVQGVVNSRTGVDGVLYGDKFELRLPIAWNGRFMYQGGGGTEGSLPSAYGTAGSAVPALAQGYAVLTQNGGHDNTLLSSNPAFALDPQAQIDFGYASLDVTTQTAKYLINTFYGRAPDHSYSVGCSTGGKESMVFSQMFPNYYDGIVAGDPIYNQGANTMSENNALQATAALSGTDPVTGAPLYYQSFSAADEQLFTSAILEACDGLDGLVDGVIDNLAACHFDPATYVFKTTSQPLECTGAKTATCLSAAQVAAIKRINTGPLNSSGQPVPNPFKPDGTMLAGYAYDGGFMSPTSGIPSRNIGTATSKPGNLAFAAVQIPYMWMSPPNPSFVPLTLNYDSDMALMSANSPMVANSTDLSAFKADGGKIIFYHGLSDPGPPVIYTENYYNKLASLNGGIASTQNFARLFLIPNMGHCGGGPSTDQFDPLAAIVNWVEKGQAPDTIIASGSNFSSAPTTRSRPLCAYPKTARYTGPVGGDISVAANYTCQ